MEITLYVSRFLFFTKNIKNGKTLNRNCDLIQREISGKYSSKFGKDLNEKIIWGPMVRSLSAYSWILLELTHGNPVST